ncbi:MAG: hypothetical protein LBR50_04195 [Tannerella sp.]|jgi:hypothetical protein|nr:hypothetical protein [Tannerella sp.]
MADKEKLETLTAHISRLLALTDEIRELDIYPVSFFSRAYDLTGKINESLKDIEAAQIEQFEQQIRAHREQIGTIVPPPVPPPPLPVTDTETPPTTQPSTVTPTVEKPLPPPPPNVTPRHTTPLTITLNDRFRFKRELFDGDETLMNTTIAELNALGDYSRSLVYLKKHFTWNVDENETAADFLSLIEKCFHG